MFLLFLTEKYVLSAGEKCVYLKHIHSSDLIKIVSFRLVPKVRSGA